MGLILLSLKPIWTALLRCGKMWIGFTKQVFWESSSCCIFHSRLVKDNKNKLKHAIICPAAGFKQIVDLPDTNSSPLLPCSNSSYLAIIVHSFLPESQSISHIDILKTPQTSARHGQYLYCLAAEENDEWSSCTSITKSVWDKIKNWWRCPSFWVHVSSYINYLCCFKKCL